MENAEELKELKARLLAVVAAYKEFTAGNAKKEVVAAATQKEEELIIPGAEGNHYFDLNGNFLGCDNKKGEQAIKIVAKPQGEGFLKFVGATNILDTPLKPAAVAKIHNFYIADKKQGLGFNISYLYNSSIVIGDGGQKQLHNEHLDYPKNMRAGGGELSAWTVIKGKKKDRLLFITVRAGRIDNSTSGNYVDLMNAIVHEIHHLKNDEGYTSAQLDDVRHLKAYFTQFDHETFVNTTPDHKDHAYQVVASMLVQIKLYAIMLKRKDLEEAYQKNKALFETKFKIQFINIDEITKECQKFAKIPPYGKNTDKIPDVEPKGFKIGVKTERL